MAKVPSMPAKFEQGKDSTSISFTLRKDFFSDKVLVALIDSALSNNFDIQRAIQRVEFSKAGLLTGRAGYLPQVNAVASAGVDKYGEYTMNGVGNFDTNLSPNIEENKRIPNPTPDYFVGLRSSWEIGIWGKARNLKKAAYNRYLASQQGRLFVITSLVAEVAEVYYELLALDNELNIIRKNILLQNKALEVMNIMKEGARANELGVRQVNAQLLNTQALEFQKIQEIRQTENKMNFLLGRYPQPIVRGLPLMEQLLPPSVSTGVPSVMVARRPDIRQAELELMASKADVSIARAAFFPSLQLSASAGFNSFNSSLLFNPASLAYGILSGLSTPILGKNIIRSTYRRAAAEQRNAYLSYHKTITSSFQEVMTSLQGIENYKSVYGVKQIEVENLLTAVNVSNDLFVSGYATYLEVITAQKSVLAAEIELSEARKLQFYYLIDLYHALGGGWE